MGHRRRRGAWGHPNRNGPPPPPWGLGPSAESPSKIMKLKEKIEMREILKNQDLTGNLLCKVVFTQKPKMIPRSIRTLG